MRPGQDARITHLFKRGYSLDLVAELGLLYGWTRNDAREVLASHGWALDWNGRLQGRFIRDFMPVMSVDIRQANPEALLNAGIDHEVTAIRRVALAAERAVEKLRTALMDQEAKEAALVAQHHAVAQALSTAFGVPFGTSGPVSESTSS